MEDLAAAPSGSLYDTLPAVRRARRIGLIAIVVAVAVSFVERPAPAIGGQGLAVTIADVVLLLSGVTLAVRADPPVMLGALMAMIAAAASLVWLQPWGAGGAGLFVAVAFAGIRLTERQAVGVWLLAAGACVPGALHAQHSIGLLVGTELGIAAFHLVARFGRSAAEAHAQTRRLLLELRASRNSEAEAAMLRERGRLARDMHDVLAHSLSGLMLQLEGARMLVAQSRADGQLSPALDRAHHLARTGLEEARRAISALRDDDLPGPNRLQQLAGDFQLDSDVPTSVIVSGTERPLDSEASLTIYRVAQEALTNIRKHAHPERVELQLHYEAESIRLAVRDSAGRPSPDAAQSTAAGGGYGLTGMHERAALLGGTVDAGRTDDGFQVELWIPA